MSKTLTYEQMMALFVKADERFAKGEKETAELRKSMAEGFAKGEKETAELRKSMAEGFAESRKETAELRASIASLHIEVFNLKVVTEKTNARVDATNARLDNAIADMKKNNARLDENNARLDEAIADMKKNNARLDENNAKLDKNNAKLDENNRKVGSLNNKLGGIIEHAVLPNIVKKFKEKGFNFKEVSVRVEILNENETKHLAEIDALLENGEFVIAVEAKTDMKISDVDAHIKRLEVLRKLSRFKGKKIYGAMATAVARKGPVN